MDLAELVTLAVILTVVLLVAALAGGIYLLPAIVAFRRSHRHRWVIAVLNALLGLTFVVWVACLAWAVWPRPDGRKDRS